MLFDTLKSPLPWMVLFVVLVFGLVYEWHGPGTSLSERFMRRLDGDDD